MPNLAVVSVSKALARKPALLGYVQSGLQPRQFALSRGTLLVANTNSAQVQAVRVDSLP
jgi:6-phosphogluconolactonase (cycloisomerase 2 family)